MNFYTLRAAVPAGFGENTILDRTTIPTTVIKLHLEFAGSVELDLMKCTPTYYVSEKLMKGIQESHLTGIESFDEIETSFHPEYREGRSNSDIPKFYLIRINGLIQKDDFSIKDLLLVISEKALSFLQNYNISGSRLDILP